MASKPPRFVGGEDKISSPEVIEGVQSNNV